MVEFWTDQTSCRLIGPESQMQMAAPLAVPGWTVALTRSVRATVEAARKLVGKRLRAGYSGVGVPPGDRRCAGIVDENPYTISGKLPGTSHLPERPHSCRSAFWTGRLEV